MKEKSPLSPPQQTEHKETAAEDRVPTSWKFWYGTGSYGINFGKQAPKQLSFQIYNVELGVNPGAIGMVLALSRLWDAFTDPLMGRISDRCDMRLGRRRPFILVGAFLSFLTFSLLWWFPREMSETFYIAYFSLVGIGFYTALTIFSVPWYAMGYESTPDYHERTRVMAWAAAFQPIAVISVGWLYAITQLDFFADPIEGARWVGIGAGAVMALTGFGCAIFAKEQPILSAREHSTLKKPKLAKAGIIRSMREASKNKPFVLLAFAVTFVLIGMTMIGSLGFYLNVYYVYAGDKQSASILWGWVFTIQQTISFIAVPLVTMLATRWGKRFAIKTCLTVSGIGYLTTYILYTPANPHLQLIVPLFLGLGNSSIFMIGNAMMADICDYDELLFGERREGLFGAIYAWIFKVGISAAFFVSGYILVWTGFDANLEADQSQSTLFSLRIIYALLPTFFLGIAFFLFSRYPISEAVSRDVREQLEARHAE